MEGFNDDKEVLQDDVKLYTGLAKCDVVALNPTMTEAEKLGISMNKEPVYADQDDEGNARVRHDVWVQLPTDTPTFTKISFFLTDKPRKSKSEKFQWKNEKGQFAWSVEEASNKYDWFSDKGERKAYPDEEALDNFMRMWGNADANASFNHDYRKTFNKGEPIEFGDIFEYINTRMSNNKIDVLLIIQNGQYQGVYKGKFGRGNAKNVRMFNSYLKKQKESSEKSGYSFNLEFQNSLKLQEYTIDPDQVFETVDEQPGKAKKGDSFKDDELPF